MQVQPREAITLTTDARLARAMARTGALAQLAPRALFPGVVAWPVTGFLLGVLFRAPATGVLFAAAGFVVFTLVNAVRTAQNIASVVKPGIVTTSTRDTDGSVELERLTGSTTLGPGEFSGAVRRGPVTVLHRGRRGGNLVVATALLPDDDLVALVGDGRQATTLARRLRVTSETQADVFRATLACGLRSPLGWGLVAAEVALLVVIAVPGILDNRSWVAFVAAVLVIPAVPLLVRVGVGIQLRIGAEIGAELSDAALLVDVPSTKDRVPYARISKVATRHGCTTFRVGVGWTVLPEALVTAAELRGRLPAKLGVATPP